MNRVIIILILALISHLSHAQNSGFFTDVRIDAKVDQDIKNYIQDRKAFLKTGVDSDSRFLWDRTGSFSQQATLYNDIDLSSYDLLSANLIFTDKDQAQKFVIAPFRLSPTLGGNPILANIKLNVALKDKITTIGIGFGGDNSSPMSARSKKLAKKFDAITSPPPPSENQDFADYKKKVLDPFDDALDEQLIKYDEARMKNVFKWTIGYNTQLFPVLFSSGSVNGFDTVNYYNIKSHNISASVTYAHDNNRIIATFSYSQIFQKNSATKGQKTVPYYGPAISLSYRMISFVKDKSKLRKLDAYKKSLFVPSINLGLSWEGKYADGAQSYYPYYQDKVEKISVFTPYLDILIAPAAQFRIAIPISKMMYPDASEQVAGGASLQYNLKLSNLTL